jgi:hypothetical protein
MSSTLHVIHVGNFPLRSECEQAARDATRPAADAILVPRVTRDFYRRAQKISPARAGPSQREETPPVQGHPQNIRVGCACHGQLQLAPARDFWDTVFETAFHRRTFCCRNGVLVRRPTRGTVIKSYACRHHWRHLDPLRSPRGSAPHAAGAAVALWHYPQPWLKDVDEGCPRMPPRMPQECCTKAGDDWRPPLTRSL